MKIISCADYEELSRKAAQIVSRLVRAKPDCVLGLATGSTPVGMYRELIAEFEAGRLDFSKASTVNLDEYIGLGPEHDQSYRAFMQKNLFDYINIPARRTHVPDGLAAEPARESARYDRLIEELGGVDLQVLGLGHNGHIGFNEPADVFTVETHMVELSGSTIAANARFFSAPDEVPRRAITMGVGAIMQARSILVLVSGEAKADIVRTAFTGPVTPQVPASVLRLHPNVTLAADQAALSRL